MYEYEPILVLPVQEILDHVDIVQTDGSVGVDQAPIVEDIARIGQERLLTEMVGQRNHGHRKIARQGFRRARFTPNKGLNHKRVVDHAHAGLGIAHRLQRQVDHGQALNEQVANPARRQQLRQRHGHVPDHGDIAG